MLNDMLILRKFGHRVLARDERDRRSLHFVCTNSIVDFVV